MLRPMRHEWDMKFAISGQEALSVLEREPVDLVVSDMRMPGMDGGVLLDMVRRRHPETMRMILSGHAHEEAAFKAVRSAQQFLPKPCDAETLKSTIDRAFSLHNLLREERLRELVSGMNALPSLPALYLEIVEILQSPDGSIQEVARVISKDIGMTSKILQLVNSAFFGLYRRVTDPGQAVSLLGVELIKALVLGVQVFSGIEGALPAGFSADLLWRHSLEVAACSRELAQVEVQDERCWSEAFTAGMLHDAGKLLLAINQGSEYETILSDAGQGGTAEWELERDMLGSTHAEVGGYLAGLWGLPAPIVEAVAFHHQPGACGFRRFEALTAVHVADAIWKRLKSEEMPPGLDMEYLQSLDLLDRVALWGEVCERVLNQGETHDR